MVYVIVILFLMVAILTAYKWYQKGRIFYFKDLAGKKEVHIDDIVIDSSTMFALTFGQSNSANHGNWKYSSKKEVYNYYKGKFYKAEDPLLGATDSGGSVWCYLGDLLIEKGEFKNVVFVSIGVGDTTAELWAVGKCRKRLKGILKELNSRGFKLTHVLYHQGETDNTIGTAGIEYKKQLRKILDLIRNAKQAAPLFISIATYNGSINNEIRNAQKEFVAENDGVFIGPDTDKVVSTEERFDGIHFSKAGAERAAELWSRAITNPSKQ